MAFGGHCSGVAKEADGGRSGGGIRGGGGGTAEEGRGANLEGASGAEDVEEEEEAKVLEATEVMLG